MVHSHKNIASDEVVANVVIVLMASAIIAWNLPLILVVGGLSIWLYSRSCLARFADAGSISEPAG